MSTATQNGAPPLDLEPVEPASAVIESRYELHLRESTERRDSVIDGLSRALEAEQVVHDELEQALTASRERLRRWHKALTAITDETPAPAPAKAKAKAKAKTPANDWTPTPAKVERVYQALVALSRAGRQDITRTMLVERASLGHDTVRRALEVLRADERIRIAGSGRGGGKLWALMPNGDGA